MRSTPKGPFQGGASKGCRPAWSSTPLVYARMHYVVKPRTHGLSSPAGRRQFGPRPGGSWSPRACLLSISFASALLGWPRIRRGPASGSPAVASGLPSRLRGRAPSAWPTGFAVATGPELSSFLPSAFMRLRLVRLKSSSSQSRRIRSGLHVVRGHCVLHLGTLRQGTVAHSGRLRPHRSRPAAIPNTTLWQRMAGTCQQAVRCASLHPAGSR